MIKALLSFLFLFSVLVPQVDAARSTAQIKSSTESQIRNIIEPILSRYCNEQCKLLTVNAEVDLVLPDDITPGFEDVSGGGLGMELSPTGVQAALLIDEMLGPVTRNKLLGLIQQHIDVLDYPVNIQTRTARFPQPAASAQRVTELREKVANDFKEKIEGLFQKFCPQQCILADFDLRVDPVNAEEAQYGSSNEFILDGDVAVRITKITATLLLDDTLTNQERQNILEMAKFKSAQFNNVTLNAKVMRFPHPVDVAEGGSFYGRRGKGGREVSSEQLNKDLKSVSNKDSKEINSKTSSNQTQNSRTENSQNTESYSRFEKIERVENGDAVQKELAKFKIFGLIFGCSILLLLILVTVAVFFPKQGKFMQPAIQKIFPNWSEGSSSEGGAPTEGRSRPASKLLAVRYEIESLLDELTKIFAEQPKVAKLVFSRVLTEEGIEVTAAYITIFGESIVMDMLRDPSLQRDLNELTDFYAKNQIELDDEEKIELLKKLHNRTVAAKLIVMGNRSSNQFDFLVEMDGLQILELIKNESLTVKAIVMTQCDSQKRSVIFSQFDETNRMKLLTELSRIDHLPKDYICNVANALRRKRKDNPRLNTEALPGSEVLVGLLERTEYSTQKTVVTSLEMTNPDSARSVKSKLVSIDTLSYLRDSHLLEVVLSLKHDELIQFLKGAPDHVRNTIMAKSPRELVTELEEELKQIREVSREVYNSIERKVLNRIKIMSNDGNINLIETNERMFSNQSAPDNVAHIQSARDKKDEIDDTTKSNLKKVAGW